VLALLAANLPQLGDGIRTGLRQSRVVQTCTVSLSAYCVMPGVQAPASPESLPPLDPKLSPPLSAAPPLASTPLELPLSEPAQVLDPLSTNPGGVASDPASPPGSESEPPNPESLPPPDSASEPAGRSKTQGDGSCGDGPHGRCQQRVLHPAAPTIFRTASFLQKNAIAPRPAPWLTMRGKGTKSAPGFAAPLASVACPCRCMSTGRPHPKARPIAPPASSSLR
jgi:hypothetical protein